MTRDEIIRLAVECQLVTTGNRDGLYINALERFASAVMQVMREQEPAILPDEAYELGLDAIPYYAAPTPPSVPERITPDGMYGKQHMYAEGWNDCIDAMLEDRT